ncbi:carboxypeptidase-like regulatory domain-containing protein [Glaciibacter sp. 2TAF33]|uniref:carboxypeptidase-like regulatory domain-containing protein n=1 Tax=Glaciibacter sp. 2TAF33 TaxID=3233015 RepID=UPI003F904F90
MKITPTIGLRRIAALGLSIAMVGGLSLVAAAPASAAPDVYTLSGSVLAQGDGASAPLQGADVAIDNGPSSVTDSNGEFSLVVEPGTLSLTIDADGYQSDSLSVTMPSRDLALGPITLQANEPPAPATYSISGVVTATDANPSFAPTVVLSGIAGSSPWQTQPDAEGNFTFERLDPSADLSLTVSAEGYGTLVKDVPVTDSDVTVTIELLPNLPAGTVSISGAQTVGSTLTATPAGWPAGTTFSFQWGAVGPHAQSSGDLDGANSSTLVVTSETVGKRIWVQAIGSKAGFADSYSDLFVSAAPKLPTMAAPAANSTDLAAFLAANDSTPQPQTSAGLPAGDLNPTKSYTANVPFTGGDDFVDVYLYSTPISVGTFPVVNGVAQVTLSASVLSQLAAGSHTLVVVGQFSGVVSSVAIGVSAVLAETGFNAGAPVGAAALLLLLGTALVLVRRRRALQA